MGLLGLFLVGVQPFTHNYSFLEPYLPSALAVVRSARTYGRKPLHVACSPPLTAQ